MQEFLDGRGFLTPQKWLMEGASLLRPLEKEDPFVKMQEVLVLPASRCAKFLSPLPSKPIPLKVLFAVHALVAHPPLRTAPWIDLRPWVEHQGRAAKDLGVSQPWLSNVLAGLHEPKFYEAAAMFAYFVFSHRLPERIAAWSRWQTFHFERLYVALPEALEELNW